MSEKVDPRIPKVIELRQEGRNWSQISKELDIPRKSLYNMRHTEGFMQVSNTLWMDLMNALDLQKDAFRTPDGKVNPYSIDQYIKNMIRTFMLVSGTSLDGLIGAPKLAECSAECPYYADKTTDRRKQLDHLVKHELKLTPIQLQVLETHVGPSRPDRIPRIYEKR